LTTFLALYRGESVSAAKLLALTTEPALVRDFATRLLEKPLREQDSDPVLEELDRGRCALQLVKSGTE
jgi:hypothetical protein